MKSYSHYTDNDFHVKAFNELQLHFGNTIVKNEFKRASSILPNLDHNCVCFLEKGLARSYYINSKGKQITLRFIEAGNFFNLIFPFSDLSGPSYNVQFLERSIVFSVSSLRTKITYINNFQLNELARRLMEKEWIGSDHRCNILRITTAKQRYRAFSEMSPEICRKVAGIHIASYLNMAPETLSRVRSSLIS
ncbi:hypothetical protein BC343_25375 [Mucilaginibacter pedocola]|uniref:Cyclic nucleotide-binding domain-containing protein n=1 Tax=Mucilaginibacter pedocola TaxID=1792845 RepID=A0A1S9PHB8_9SPHI|nr:hypothetical protein BC343_25375 [Mucilaginibacter pedocola]